MRFHPLPRHTLANRPRSSARRLRAVSSGARLGRRRCGHVLVETLVALALVGIAGGALMRLLTAAVLQGDRESTLARAASMARDAAESLVLEACSPSTVVHRIGRVELRPDPTRVGPLTTQRLELVLDPHAAAAASGPRTLQMRAAGWCP